MLFFIKIIRLLSQIMFYNIPKSLYEMAYTIIAGSGEDSEKDGIHHIQQSFLRAIISRMRCWIAAIGW